MSEEAYAAADAVRSRTVRAGLGVCQARPAGAGTGIFTAHKRTKADLITLTGLPTSSWGCPPDSLLFLAPAHSASVAHAPCTMHLSPTGCLLRRAPALDGQRVAMNNAFSRSSRLRRRPRLGILFSRSRETACVQTERHVCHPRPRQHQRPRG